MDISLMTIGVKLEMELVNSLDQKIGQTYVSQLIDIVDNDNIIAAAPIHEARLTLIPNGTRIRVIFQNEKHGLLSFIGVISKKEKNGNILTFHIKVTGKMEKIQRRMYFRLPCILDAMYHIIENTESDEAFPVSPEEQVEIQWKKAITRNISGNGVSLAIEEELPKGTMLKLKVYLNNSSVINITGHVVRCINIRNDRLKKYELGICLAKLDKNTENILIKYIFEQQKALLKNNLDKA